MRRSEVFLSASVSTIDDFLISEIGQTLPSEGFLFSNFLPGFFVLFAVFQLVYLRHVDCARLGLRFDRVCFFIPPLRSSSPSFLPFFSRCSRDNAGSARADLPFVCNFSLATARFPFRFPTAARATSRNLFYVGDARNGSMRANSSRGIRRADDVRIDRRPFFRDLSNVRFPS